jgi:hypothetical protein
MLILFDNSIEAMFELLQFGAGFDKIFNNSIVVSLKRTINCEVYFVFKVKTGAPFADSRATWWTAKLPSRNRTLPTSSPRREFSLLKP